MPTHPQADARDKGKLEDLARAVATQIETLGARERTVVLRPEAPASGVRWQLWRSMQWVCEELPVPRAVAQRFRVTDVQRERAERELTAN